MPSLRERRGRWYITVCHHGQRREIAAGNVERLARLRLAEIEAEIERGKAGFLSEKPPSLREQIRRWTATHAKTLAPSTQLRCRQYAAVALRILDGEKPASADDVRRFQAQRVGEVRPKTVNNETAWLMQVLRDADGRLPFRPIKKLKLRGGRLPRWLTKEEVQRMLAAAPVHARPYLEGYLLTGARRGELVALTWSSWDRAHETLRLPNQKTAGRVRGDTHRVVPVHPRLREILETRHKAGLPSPFPAPQDDHRMRTWVVRAAQKAGIAPPPTLHSLRHTFAAHLVQAGTDLRTVGALLGHTNPATTMIYAHLAPSTLARAVKLLDYWVLDSPSDVRFSVENGRICQVKSARRGVAIAPRGRRDPLADQSPHPAGDVRVASGPAGGFDLRRVEAPGPCVGGADGGGLRLPRPRQHGPGGHGPEF